MFIDLNKETLKYPCQWFCRIITDDISTISTDLNNTLSSLGYPAQKVTAKNKSKGNKYISFELTMILTYDGEMNKIVNALKQVPHVKIVI